MGVYDADGNLHGPDLGDYVESAAVPGQNVRPDRMTIRVVQDGRDVLTGSFYPVETAAGVLDLNVALVAGLPQAATPEQLGTLVSALGQSTTLLPQVRAATNDALATTGISPTYISETTADPPAAPDGTRGSRRTAQGGLQRLLRSGGAWVAAGAAVAGQPQVSAISSALSTPNLAALAAAPTDTARVVADIGEGLGAVFAYDSTATGKPSTGMWRPSQFGGAWKNITSDPADIRVHGAKKGNSNSGAAVRYAMSETGRVVVPDGDWTVDDGHLILGNLGEFAGLGRQRSKLRLGSGCSMIYGSPSPDSVRTIVHDLWLQAAVGRVDKHVGLIFGSDPDNSSGTLKGTSADAERTGFNGSLSNLYITDFAVGLKSDGNTWSARFSDVSTAFNNVGTWLDYDGYQNAGSNVVLRGLLSFNNTQEGIRIDGASADGVYVVLDGTNAEGNPVNYRFRALAAGEFTVRFLACHAEQQATRHVLNEGATVFMDLTGIGMIGANTAQAYMIEQTAGRLVVDGGRLAGGDYTTLIKQSGGTVYVTRRTIGSWGTGGAYIASTGGTYHIEDWGLADKRPTLIQRRIPVFPAVGQNGTYGAVSSALYDTVTGPTPVTAYIDTTGIPATSPPTVTVLIRLNFSDGTNSGIEVPITTNTRTVVPNIADLYQSGKRPVGIDVYAKSSAGNGGINIAMAIGVLAQAD